jgi:predicted HicB family RNase H-like nuclease
LAVLQKVCKEKGIEPRRHCSGKFNLRIPPELHERLAVAAQAEGKNLTMLEQEAFALRVAV